MAFEEVVYSGSQSGANGQAMNFVSLRQIVDDFIVTMDSDDYISNVSDVAIRNIALRGIREFGFDISSRIRSLKRTAKVTSCATSAASSCGRDTIWARYQVLSNIR